MNAAGLDGLPHVQGIECRVDGDTLQYRPAHGLALHLLAELKRHKWSILALLAADAAGVAERVAAMRARHPLPWSSMPFLTVADVSRAALGCRSCGEPPEAFGGGLVVRCRPRALAAWLVLDEPAPLRRLASVAHSDAPWATELGER